MDQAPVPLSDLKIIGHADRFSSEALPCMTTPVFCRVTDQQQILFPPFRLDDHYVYQGQWDTRSRWRGQIESGQMTEFMDPFPAQSDHLLWIDMAGDPRYDRRAVVLRKLEALARDLVTRAQADFCDGDLESANEKASQAINADERNIDALIVKAAVSRVEGKAERVNFYASHAQGLTIEDFSVLVDRLCRNNGTPRPSPVAGACLRQRDEATEKLFSVVAA